MSYHVPVLVKEVIEGMKLRENGIYVDATLGGGGHSEKMLESVGNFALYGFDQDPDAIAYAEKRLSVYQDRIHIIKDNFRHLRSRLALCKIKQIDGILMDIGVSNYQLMTGERGFSFMQDAQLDMRMDKTQKLTAETVVNEYEPGELKRAFFEYGEENFSAQIVSEIVRQREKKRITRTSELADIIEGCVRRSQKKYTVNHEVIKSKARIFQALRIVVNDELTVLESALKDAVNILKPGGRIVVISWHSLEDRIVKQFFQQEAKGCVCPVQSPMCVCGKESRLKVITRKPVIPTDEEIGMNSNAKSAKLRIAERIGGKQT